MPARLTHVRKDGSVAMVDVGRKRSTARAAVAEAIVRMNAAAYGALKDGTLHKGDALALAQIAGVMAAKRTAELIPLCHSLQLSHVDVDVRLTGSRGVTIRCEAKTMGPTGVEMEALTGAAVAALSIYDMCKALDRGITIEALRLVEKSGGRSGTYRR